MDTVGPASATRIEPQRSDDRQPRDQQQQRKSNTAPGQNTMAGKNDDDRAQVAAAETESHQLDERA